MVSIRIKINNIIPSYNKESFESKSRLRLNYFIDMAVCGYGGIAV